MLELERFYHLPLQNDYGYFRKCYLSNSNGYLANIALSGERFILSQQSIYLCRILQFIALQTTTNSAMIQLDSRSSRRIHWRWGLWTYRSYFLQWYKPRSCRHQLEDVSRKFDWNYAKFHVLGAHFRIVNRITGLAYQLANSAALMTAAAEENR